MNRYLCYSYLVDDGLQGQIEYKMKKPTLMIKATEVDTRIRELEEVIRDMLDAYWDMSPLQYAQSRGFQCMTDEVGEEIKRRARRLVATEALKEKK